MQLKKLTVSTTIVDVNGAIQHSKTKEYTLDTAFAGVTEFKAKDANYEFNKADGSTKYALKAVVIA